MTVSFKSSRKRWTYDFRLNGRRFTGYCVDAHGDPVTSRSAAKQAEGVARRRAAMEPKVARPDELTMAGAAAALIPMWERQADWKNKKRYLKELLAYFGAERAMASISEADIQDYVSWSIQQNVRVWTGGPTKEADLRRPERATQMLSRTRSPATVNLHLHMLRQIFGRAGKVRDALGNRAIAEMPKIPVLDTAKRRARPVPDDVLSRLITLLPKHVLEAIYVTLFFGLRKSEVFSLQTFQVDFRAGGIRLEAENVKDDEDAFLHGAPEAMTFLALLCGEAATRRTTYLITYGHGDLWRPIKSPRTAWATAMTKIEAEFGRKWRWHDLRAAFITHVALTSGPEMARLLARHSEYKTTLGYVAVADEMRREAARRAAVRPALSMIGGGKVTDGIHRQESRLQKETSQVIETKKRPRSSAG